MWTMRWAWWSGGVGRLVIITARGRRRMVCRFFFLSCLSPSTKREEVEADGTSTGHDVCTEVTGQSGKLSVNVVPQANNVVLADRRGISHEVQPEYWQRFEDAFATEAQEFITSVLNDTPVPLPLESGLKVMVIGRALQDALLTGEVQRFDEQGQRIGK